MNLSYICADVHNHGDFYAFVTNEMFRYTPNEFSAIVDWGGGDMRLKVSYTVLDDDIAAPEGCTHGRTISLTVADERLEYTDFGTKIEEFMPKGIATPLSLYLRMNGQWVRQRLIGGEWFSVISDSKSPAR